VPRGDLELSSASFWGGKRTTVWREKRFQWGSSGEVGRIEFAQKKVWQSVKGFNGGVPQKEGQQKNVDFGGGDGLLFFIDSGDHQ